MRDRFSSSHYDDAAGNPAGGRTNGTGLQIIWQDGPLGRGADRIKPNGAFVETVIAAAMDRLEYYQRSRFACDENRKALKYLARALGQLEQRTQRREAYGIEGTHVRDIPCSDCNLMSEEIGESGNVMSTVSLCQGCQDGLVNEAGWTITKSEGSKACRPN